MVKGITRQVILIQSPDRRIFEQAIFIVKENAAEYTDELLLKEAQKAVQQSSSAPKRRFAGLLWACAGAGATALVWLLTALL